MLDIEKTNKKLKDLYIKLCQDTPIYTKEEAIEVFDTFNFTEEDAIEIYPVDTLEEEMCDELINGELEKNEDEEEVIFFSGDIEEDLSEYDEEQIFNVEFPEEIELKIMADKFKVILYSNQFTNDERGYIFQMLLDKTLEHCDSPFLSKYDDIKLEYKKFVTRCGINDFINKFITDENFCKFVFDVYTITLFDKNTKPNDKENNIISVNDLIREKFVLIHNKNVSYGATNNDSVSIILKYLKGNYSSDEMNKTYNMQLGSYKIEDISDKTYMIIIMITDYLRMCELKYDQYKELDEVDLKFLRFINDNELKEIINKFKRYDDFASTIVSEFIQLNLYCSDETKKSCKNTELIKRLNPLYKLDYLK